MVVYRLAKQQFSTSLSGIGASICGGRWNSIGTEMIYCSSSQALCVLESFVHLPQGTTPKDMIMLSIDIPESIKINHLDTKSLSPTWNRLPYSIETQKIGDNFIDENNSCVLSVPSAIIPNEHNFLINPAHFDFSKISISAKIDFPFDNRLFNK